MTAKKPHSIEELWHLPIRHIDYSKIAKINEIQEGEVLTITARITSIQVKRGAKIHLPITEAFISDDTGTLKAIWFNQPYLLRYLEVGKLYQFAGKIDNYKSLYISNPIFEGEEDGHLNTGRIVPVYKLGPRIPQKTYRKKIYVLLSKLQIHDNLLPKELLDKYKLKGLAETIKHAHFPPTLLELRRAQERLAFEELFIYQLSGLLRAKNFVGNPAFAVKPDIGLIKSALASLPFKLTSGQRKAVWEIAQDLSLPKPMNRLLQGDVGSGKTVVAVISALSLLAKQLQIIILSPTEVLAKQHHKTISEFFGALPLPFKTEVILLTRNYRQVYNKIYSKSQLIKKISKGGTQIIVGTHALLEESIKLNACALIVIDEQHRFGVTQRQLLRTKIDSEQATPHLLSMSATPIPRTLALTLYADLSVSQLKELPLGRLPVKTWVVPEGKRLGAYDFIRKEVRSGRQAFIITPLVEDSEKMNVKAVKSEYSRLQKDIFPDLGLEIVYGGQKSEEKEKAMRKFSSGESQILVATSVIEIGIDVPNATIILIESAERFGLSQLHQLRGRVGRSNYQSYCLLFPTDPNSESTQRLESFSKINSGFELAELDLKQRGFGSLFGTEQTGFSFTYSQFTSPSLLVRTLDAAKWFLASFGQEHFPILFDKAKEQSEKIHLE